MCGIIGVYKTQGDANVELYEGLLMLQHRGQVRWLRAQGLVGEQEQRQPERVLGTS